jgi:tetratricopeptide (TPR) repeat protein
MDISIKYFQMVTSKYFHILATIIFFSFLSCATPENETKETSKEIANQVDSTLSRLNNQISENPDNDDLFIERAGYYLRVDKIDSALRDIMIAIDIDKTNAHHFITLSDAYLALGNPDKSLEALEKAIQLDEKNKEALLKKAQLYLIMRNYSKTYSSIEKLLQIDGINPMAYFVRSLGYLEQADTVKAVADLRKAIDQDQNYFDAQFQLGVIYAKQKNPLAINYFQNAININKNLIEPYYQLGLFFQENGRIENAQKTYFGILDIDPEYYPALYNLGYIELVHQKNFRKAADYFTQVIQFAPEYTDAWYNRGFSFELLGQKEPARQDYEQTLKIESNYPKAIEALNRLDAHLN